MPITTIDSLSNSLSSANMVAKRKSKNASNATDAKTVTVGTRSAAKMTSVSSPPLSELSSSMFKSPTPMSSSASSFGFGSVRKSIGQLALEENGGDVTKGTWVDNSDSPLMKLPREIRDKIYAALLTSRLSDSDQELANALSNASAQPGSDRNIATELDMVNDQAGILPGGTKQYPFITEAMGLLLTCKQLHTEANAYLYGENAFIILPEHERIHCFWHCEGEFCRPDVPCLVHTRNIAQIKQVYILIQNPQRFENATHDLVAKRLAVNLHSVVQAFTELSMKLKTLKVRYISHLEGQIEAVRPHLDSILQPGEKTKNKSIILRSHLGGKGYCVKPGQRAGIIFKNTSFLNALKDMPGIAEDVTIVGDLPSAIIKDLTHVLTAKKSLKMLLKKQAMQAKDDERIVQQRQTQNDNRAAFFGSVADKYPDDPVMRDLCKRIMARPIYSPTIMLQMFGPPTAEELKRACGSRSWI